jgi:hypothetical protein
MRSIADADGSHAQTFEPWHRPAGDFGEPERERSRIVLLGDALSST